MTQNHSTDMNPTKQLFRNTSGVFFIPRKWLQQTEAIMNVGGNQPNS